MAQVEEGKQSRGLVIRRSYSKPKRAEVVARIPDVEWEVSRDVCLRKYGARARVAPWEDASLAQQELSVNYIERPVRDGEVRVHVGSMRAGGGR